MTQQLLAKYADPTVADPKHYTVELENERIRVLRVKYGPGEKSVMHSHPASIHVFLTDCSARFTYPDGTTEDVKIKAGQLLEKGAFEHLPENFGGPLELIQIEFKR